MPNENYSRAQLDAMARRRGFPDYATWAAWHEKYRSTVRKKKEPEKRNWLQQLTENIPVHPNYLLRHVQQRMVTARKKSQE